MKITVATSFLLAASAVMLTLTSCIVPGAPPNYAYGNPYVFIPPLYVPSHGYGYWYGGNYWGYRKGYSFYNGHYYRANGARGGGYGGNRGYGGDAGWSRNGGY